VTQVAKHIESIINDFLAENETIIIPIAVDKLSLIILENMLIIIKTSKFDFDVFIEILWKWAFITGDIHKSLAAKTA